MKKLARFGIILFFSVILLASTITIAFAESPFEEPVMGVFDWLDGVFQTSIDESGLDNSTQTNLGNTLDAGIDAGKTGTSLWFGIHAFVKELIFAGASEAGFDESTKDFIGWVAILAVFFMLLSILKHLFKENAKIVLIVVGVLIVLGITGIVIEF